MNRKTFLFLSTLGLFFLSSCITYYIPLESFKQQFAGIDSSKYKDVIVQGPSFLKYYYKANPIRTIKCITKQNMPTELINSPSIEVRITCGCKKTDNILF